MEAEIILINGNDIRTINVIVKTKSNFYSETNQQFGISKNELIEKKGKTDFESSRGVIHDNHLTNMSQALYIFDYENKLLNNCVMINTSQSSNFGIVLK